MLYSLIFILFARAQAQDMSLAEVHAHPLYPIALSHVLNGENTKWQTLSEDQQTQAYAELKNLIHEEKQLEERIEFVENLIQHPDSHKVFIENRAVDRNFSRSFDILPKNRLQYLERVADAFAHVVKLQKTPSGKSLELKAIALRLLQEAEMVAQGADGRPSQVGQEAIKIWAGGMIASITTVLISSNLHLPNIYFLASTSTFVISLGAFMWNVEARDTDFWRPILYLPGAYERSANRVAASLQRRFWTDVEVALLRNGIHDGSTRPIEIWADEQLPDVRSLNCASVLRPQP